jgi:hypothetical protein
MGARDRKSWAREMILAEIDAAIGNNVGMCPADLEFDDHTALRHERNRVAKLFGLPVKKEWK